MSSQNIIRVYYRWSEYLILQMYFEYKPWYLLKACRDNPSTTSKVPVVLDCVTFLTSSMQIQVKGNLDPFKACYLSTSFYL